MKFADARLNFHYIIEDVEMVFANRGLFCDFALETENAFVVQYGKH